MIRRIIAAALLLLAMSVAAFGLTGLWLLPGPNSITPECVTAYWNCGR